MRIRHLFMKNNGSEMIIHDYGRLKIDYKNEDADSNPFKTMIKKDANDYGDLLLQVKPSP